MGFIHRQQVDGCGAGKFQKAVGEQPFRRHINDLVLTQHGIFQRFEILGTGKGGVEKSACHTGLAQALHLVTHQGDERGYHQSDAGKHQAGHLVTDGFAGAGGHDAQSIPALQNGVNDRLLPLAELVVAKYLF